MNRKLSCILILMLTACMLAGCSGGAAEKVNTNTVEGFLFSFDQREKTRMLADAIHKKEYPVRVEWLYAPDGEKASVQETEDAERIQDICMALSNAIIIDNAKDLTEDTSYYVALTLADGTECRFDFVSQSVIRLSEQNYAVETDGNLWKLLREE